MSEGSVVIVDWETDWCAILNSLPGTDGSGITIIFGPPANIRYGLTVLIHNSSHFGPPLPFWAPGPPGIARAADG